MVMLGNTQSLAGDERQNNFIEKPQTYYIF
jgi:hypothetical protein